MRQTKQGFRNRQQHQQRRFRLFDRHDVPTPNDAATKRHMGQRFYTKRHMTLTQSDTAFMCQMRQGIPMQVVEIAKVESRTAK
jgi:hypothetical protein